MVNVDFEVDVNLTRICKAANLELDFCSLEKINNFISRTKNFDCLSVQISLYKGLECKYRYMKDLISHIFRIFVMLPVTVRIRHLVYDIWSSKVYLKCDI